jgi:hypothetical protein
MGSFLFLATQNLFNLKGGDRMLGLKLIDKLVDPDDALDPQRNRSDTQEKEVVGCQY